MNIPNGMKLRHIEAFLAVARSGTITAAAQARHVSQPALSKTLSELETLLATKLFDRTGRRAVLTPAGESFRAHSMVAIQSLEKGVRDIGGEGPGDLVKVGVLPTVAGGIFPSVALEMARLRPEVRIGVMTGPNAYLIDLLRAGKIDLMVGRMPRASDMPGLSFEHLYDEPIVMVGRAGHPAMGMDARQAIAKYPLILPNPGAIIRKTVDQYIAAMGATDVRPAFETVALPVALTLLESSDMLWFISRGVVAREIGNGALVTLDLKADYMAGAVGITRKFAFGGDSPADLLARLLHRKAAQSDAI
ncbi:LysR substrate-binding domain-containing protein [Celeribacter arenosi]|uniref:Pca operon transcription factor PcaQ n=1 Tax=Celeribacter arenosi TaxID=792649 RepID=A0ABP7KIS7_9RHOB